MIKFEFFIYYSEYIFILYIYILYSLYLCIIFFKNIKNILSKYYSSCRIIKNARK